jgi:hypothetical protein
VEQQDGVDEHGEPVERGARAVGGLVAQQLNERVEEQVDVQLAQALRQGGAERGRSEKKTESYAFSRRERSLSL